MLDELQKRRAIDALQVYLGDGGRVDGKSHLTYYRDLDQSRLSLLGGELGPLVERFLSAQLPLSDFKSSIDSLNKRNEYWGFKGVKGQMFFNMVYNAAADVSELEAELRGVLGVPANEEMARSRITTFVSYVKRLGDDHVAGGSSKHSRPKVSSIPFFLSYFWHIQQPTQWPIFYTNSVSALQDLNIWQPVERLGDSYVEFKHVHEVLQALFTQQTGQPVSHYEVEHVLDVHLHGTGADQSEAPPSSGTPHASGFETVTPIKLLPESYVPPVIETLSRLASNEPSIVTAAQASGLSIERAFEKTTHTAFTVLGYHTELLGQGKGRVPDGRAEEPDASYIIIWDAKVRADGYSMGTDDRTIREYIATQSRELRRKRSTRNLYYVVVSSTFREDYDDAIRAIKMETDISEVVLLEAAALVEMVNLRLRNPLDVTLGPDGLQRLFASSGIVSADVVRNTFGA